MTATPDYDAVFDEIGDPFAVAAEIAEAIQQPLPTIEQARTPEVEPA